MLQDNVHLNYKSRIIALNIIKTYQFINFQNISTYHMNTALLT